MIDNYMFLRFISRDFTLREGSVFTLRHTVTRKMNTLDVYSVEHISFLFDENIKIQTKYKT